MTKYIFLQNLSDELYSQYNSLISNHINNLPYTLSNPVFKATEKIKSENYGAAMNYVLDFFEISVQYSSIILFSILKKTDDPSILKVLTSVTNKIDSKRPLSFGDWVNDIFMPLQTIAFSRLPEHPFVNSINSHIYSKKKNILLGGKKEVSIVQIRNEYKGHSTTLSEEIYKGVLYTLENRIISMLYGLTSLSEYDFITIDEDNKVWNMKGNKPKQNTSGLNIYNDFHTNHYYIVRQDNNTNEIHDLFPLVFRNKKGHIYVFQSLKDENISYISSNENAITYISDTLNDETDAFFQQIIPSFDIAKELNWDELKQCMCKESTQFMNNIYKEKKYNQELFVDRERLSNSLHQFYESDKTLFPLLGDAGQGKTSQLCFWTESLLLKNEAVIIFSGADFCNYSLDNKIKSIFGYNPRRDIFKLLDSIHKKAEANNQFVYIFFDAINECMHYGGTPEQEEGPLYLYKDIVNLFIHEKYPRLKVLYTCRLYTWKNLIQSYTADEQKFIYSSGNEENIAIRNFTDEEVKKAYIIYQRFYQMTTQYDDIDKKIVIRLKDPLILKFVSSNYLGKTLSYESSDYTSISLFEKMLIDIKNSYAGKLQYEIITSIGDFLLKKHLSGTPTNSISTEDIKNAYNNPNDELNKLSINIYKKDGLTIAYTELLNKSERPVLRESEKLVNNKPCYELTFIYERFLEFVMARSFLHSERNESANLTEPVPAEKYLMAIEKARINVIMIGTLRNALVIDCLQSKSYNTILQLASLHSHNYIVMQIITEVMNMLIKENFENELFGLIDQMLSSHIPGQDKLISELNIVNKKIESNKADNEVIRKHKILSKELSPVIKLRKLASISIINGILLTDYFNENLYKTDALDFLWRLMTDKIHEIRNDSCMYTYYLSNKTHTLDYTPLKNNLCETIIHQMYNIIKSKPLVLNLGRKHSRLRSLVFFETATRLATLLMIDEVISGNRNPNIVKNMIKEIENIARYFTFNFYLIKAFMPVLQILMRKQITFQSTYVNNAIEYQRFWNLSDFSGKSKNHKWTRECIKEAMSFIWHNSKFYDNPDSAECKAEEIRFKDFHPYILSAYKTGDSFSYFTLERILVIMGVSKWENIRTCIKQIFTEEFRKSEWFNYSQMSILYVMFQVAQYSKEDITELLDIYTKEAEIWTLNCKGLFKAPNSHKANPTGFYKRNVMTWYCIVYCSHIGDGNIRKGDTKCVPLFYSLIDMAIEQNDRELLIHLIENISELITDFGYINTAMGLLKYILIKYDTEEKVNKINEVETSRTGIYQYDLIGVIGNVLSTAKNYHQTEVNSFIKKEIYDLSFPGIPIYKDEILSYSPSGENLSDLFTHKFGKFLTWGLLFENTIDNFAYEAMCTATNSHDCFEWYEKVVKVLLRYIFNIKL